MLVEDNKEKGKVWLGVGKRGQTSVNGSSRISLQCHFGKEKERMGNNSFPSVTLRRGIRRV